MRIALTPDGPKHLDNDFAIWDHVKAGIDVIVARPLIRKPKIRITRHYQSPGHYCPSYSDRETQARDLWQAVRDDDPAIIHAVVARARKLKLI